LKEVKKQGNKDGKDNERKKTYRHRGPLGAERVRRTGLAWQIERIDTRLETAESKPARLGRQPPQQQGLTQEKEAAAFDGKSPPLATDAKDGAPSVQMREGGACELVDTPGSGFC
jgi:hypothetical protein